MRVGDKPRWLIVVQRQNVDLYQHLDRRFRDIGFVRVIVDRRTGDRRRLALRVERDRRHADRRRPPTGQERDHWRLFGYRLVYGGEAVSPLVPSLEAR
jgi:hypothetical protein